MRRWPTASACCAWTTGSLRAPRCLRNASWRRALHVSRSTVAAAYRSLRDSGHIASTRGSGSVTLPLRRRDPGRAHRSDGAIDLQQASPPAWPGLAGVMSEVAASAAALVSRVGYDVLGRIELREAIAAPLLASAASRPRPSEIIVTTGAQSAIHLLASVLLGRGDRVLIETPTYPHAADALRRAGARLVGVPVTTADGWDLDRAEQAFARTLPVHGVPDARLPEPDRPIDDRGGARGDPARGGAGRDPCSCSTRRPPTSTSTAGRFRRASSTAIPRSSSASARSARPCGADCASAGSAARPTSSGGSWPPVPLRTWARPSSSRRSPRRSSPTSARSSRSARMSCATGRDAARRRALAERCRSGACRACTGGVSLWIELDAPLSSALVMDVRSRGLLLSAGPALLGGGRPRPAPPHPVHRAAGRTGPSGRHPRRGVAARARRGAGRRSPSSSTPSSERVSEREATRHSTASSADQNSPSSRNACDSARGSAARCSGRRGLGRSPGGGRSRARCGR